MHRSFLLIRHVHVIMLVCPYAVPNYKALYNYKPQNEGDLQLAIGDWVTLKETPYGGDWWRGAVEGKGEGWFPKNYVKYVDVEAEKKKREAGK